MYGDPINPSAWSLALSSVQRVLKSNGRFYLAAQTGRQNVLHFNSGRVFTLDTICDTLNKMQLDELHFIKGNELDTHLCIQHKEGVKIINDDNMNYLLNQDSITTLMVFKKL